MFESTLSSSGPSVVTQTTGVDLIEQRDRTVLHLSGGVGLGRDVGDLLQLERSLEAHREADVTAEVEEEVTVAVALGDLAHLVLAGVHEHLDLVRDRPQLADQPLDLAPRERPAKLGQLQRDQVDGGDLRQEGLGGGHADLEPGARIEDAVRVTGRLTADDVRDRQHRGALLAREAHRRKRVGGLP